MKKEQTIIKFDNIKDLLYHSANTYADNIAFTTKIKNGKEVEYINHTYTNLLENINYFGTSLYKLGLQGKRSAVVGHNCYEWAVAHLSNLLGGIISVPLDKGLQIGELEDSLIRSEVESIVFDEKLKDVISEIKASGKTNIKHFICFSKVPGFLYFYDLIDDGKKAIEAGYLEYINYKVNPSAMSILLFTSGTTSKSKAVMLTHNTEQKYKGTARPDMEGQMIRNYSMLYDKKMKMAHWVAYPLHRCYTEKNVDRKDNWVSDPLVGENEFQAVVSKSYGGKIYRRGHQIPSNDRVATMEMNNQTFYFTNQTPQRQDKFNGAIWMNLEHRINSWSTASDTVYVVTGAVPPSDDATWIKEKSIKDNDGKDIPIPSYYFKAVARKIGGKYHTIAFWMQHRDYTDSQSYMKYAVSVSDLEKNTGFEFFPGLDESTKSQLDLSKWQ